MSASPFAFVFGAPDDPEGMSRPAQSSPGQSHLTLAAPADPDAAVVDRLRAHDPSAIDIIMERHYARLVGFAESLVDDRGTAEDVVQNTLVALWERRATLALRSTLVAYLFGSVRNAALNARRSSVRELRRHEAAATSAPATIPTPDHALEQAEQERMVQAAVAALAPLYREVILLRAGGLTYDAIASVLQLPVKTAKTRGLRGIAALRAALAEKI
jgi:RNA polymerase sigma factor (sigma-70 family)